MTATTVLLRRTVRFCLGVEARSGSGSGFGGLAAPRGLPAYFELDVTVRGAPDPVTGYLVGIAEIDAAVRREVVPWLEARWRDDHGSLDPRSLLPAVWTRLADALPAPLAAIEWRLTPFHAISISGGPSMTDPHRVPVLLRQRFEFCAAHRLHAPDLDDAANRALFGKCNYPSGHGHNYRVETAVAVPPSGGPTMEVIEGIVGREVIERWDHRHLNLDLPEFRTLNPSVENIAKVAHDRLASPIAAAGGELRQVTVWETDKTCCTYPA